MSKAKKMLLLGVYGMEAVECGGALAINVKNGGESYASIMLSSEKSREQVEKAGEILGLKKVYFNNFEAGTVDLSREKKVELIRVIREVKPDVIITQDPEHSYHDLDPDRRPAMLLLLEVIALASRRFALEDMPELEPHPIPKIYYMSPENPNCILNIASVWDLKDKAMDVLESQMEFSGRHFEHGLNDDELDAIVPGFKDLETYYEKGRYVHREIDKALHMYHGVCGHGHFALAEAYRFEGKFEFYELD
ncbi:LmbE-like protein [Wukongibacter baidiensis]|uniref:PIG-L deacetylase family protein n=1 Tax=Wukongibacter baidiensis TaxID=1723361 RepID=UPI003D7FF85F